jgi:peptide/nickel transport system substrate-binding protein
MESGGYWSQFGRFGRRVTRRRVLVGGGSGAAALFLAACSGSSKNNSSGSSAPAGGASSSASNSAAAPAAAPTGAPLTNASATTAAAPSQIFVDAKSKPVTGKESVEELRDRFAQKNLKFLPGQKNGPKYGGTLRTQGLDLPPSWDLTGPTGSQLASWAMFHNKLIDFEIGDMSANTNIMTLTGDLADVPQQPDNQTYIFKLRPGIKWQNIAPTNGRAFTTDDVVYAAQAYQKAPGQATIYRDVDSVTAPDQNTVVFKMKQPAAYFLRAMSQPMNLIFSREQHDSSGGLGSGPVGTGAFIYVSGTQNQGFKVRKNPDYFKKDQWTGKQLPYLDGIEFITLTDADRAAASFRNGDLDVYTTADKSHWLDFLKTNPALVSTITTPPPSAQCYYAWNLEKPPFNDVRVRQALSLGIDRDALSAAVYDDLAGYGYAQDQSFFGQEWPWTKDQLGQYVNFDVKQAKQLLAAAGFPNGGVGRTLDFYYINGVGLQFNNQQLVADQWKRNLGVEVNNIIPPDAASWLDQFYSKKYTDVIMAWVAGPSLDPDAYAYGALNSKSPNNYFHVNDPMLDQLTQAQQNELDIPKRQQILQQIMKQDLDQAYRLWTLNGYKINVRYPYVYGITDQIHAWCPLGWGSKGVEECWFDK